MLSRAIARDAQLNLFNAATISRYSNCRGLGLIRPNWPGKIAAG